MRRRGPWTLFIWGGFSFSFFHFFCFCFLNQGFGGGFMTRAKYDRGE